MPDVEPIVAMPVLPLVHVPPPVASESTIELPTHTEGDDGDIAPGPGFTVINFVATQLPIE